MSLIRRQVISSYKDKQQRGNLEKKQDLIRSDGYDTYDLDKSQTSSKRIGSGIVIRLKKGTSQLQSASYHGSGQKCVSEIAKLATLG